jgi:hypothetical protein
MKSGQTHQTIIFTKVVKWAIQITRDAIWPNVGPLPLVLFDDIAPPPFLAVTSHLNVPNRPKYLNGKNEVTL